MRLAVDNNGKYAYVVEKELLGADEKDALGLVRIDLASEPARTTTVSTTF